MPVTFVSPKEGTLAYCCGLVLVKGAARRDEVYDLIYAMTDPAAGKWLIETYGYGHSSSKAFDLVDEAMLKKRCLPPGSAGHAGRWRLSHRQATILRNSVRSWRRSKAAS